MMVEALTLFWKSHVDVSLKCYTLMTTAWGTKGGIRDLCVVAGLQPHQDHRDVGGQLTQLKHCDVGYRLFGKDRPGWGGGGVILYVRKHGKPAKSLWVSISRQINISNNVVGA